MGERSGVCVRELRRVASSLVDGLRRISNRLRVFRSDGDAKRGRSVWPRSIAPRRGDSIAVEPGVGLGYGVVVDRGEAATPLSEGSAYWGGAYCTLSWIDRTEEIVAVLMTQVRPYGHINIRQDFQVLVHQAIVE